MARETKTLSPPERGPFRTHAVSTAGAKWTVMPVLLAILVLALLAAGAWASAMDADDRPASWNAAETGRYGSADVSPDEGIVPAARLHPRGLPRRNGRVYAKSRTTRTKRRSAGSQERSGIESEPGSHAGPEGGWM